VEVRLVPDIELKKIRPNRLNPRLEFTKAGLDELADSIKQVGLLEPIIVRPYEGEYQVVVGERRYRAAQQAGLDKVPVIIRSYSDAQVIELNLVENIQREDLSDVEKGKCCAELMKRLPENFPTMEAVAKRVGVSANLVSQWLQTTKVPEEIQPLISATERRRELIPKGRISADTARVIQRQIREPEKQVELAKTFAARPTPVRQVRQIIKAAAREPGKPIQQVFKEVVEEAPIFLPFSKAHADAIVKEIKTQTSRKAKDPRLQKGVTVRAQVTHFADLEVMDVYRKRLGDFDEEDARREGGYTLDEFKGVWKALHGEWNPNESVYVVRFRLKRVVGESSNSG